MADVEQESRKYIVPGLQRGLQILRAFDRDRTQIGAPDIAKELDIPRSTVFRLMQTLEFMGFLEKVEHSSDYRLSVGVLSLGFVFLASLEVTELQAKVSLIDPIVDAASGTFGVRLELPNSDWGIPAGLECQVRFGEG